MLQKTETEPDFQDERDRIHLQMMSAVSHDLKTPLASVIGSLEIFNKMRSVLSEEKKETLIATALQEAYRLDGFISNLLDMSRLENGMTRPNKQLYDIEHIIDESLQKLGERARRAKIHIDRPQSPVICMTDTTLLGRALQCILDNSLKYSAATPEIFISYEFKDDTVFIHISDNGSGIMPENHERVFDKHTRLIKKDYQNAGTGLGLTLARALVRLLGGEISINKERHAKGVGAWFTVSLPCIECQS